MKLLRLKLCDFLLLCDINVDPQLLFSIKIQSIFCGVLENSHDSSMTKDTYTLEFLINTDGSFIANSNEMIIYF